MVNYSALSLRKKVESKQSTGWLVDSMAKQPEGGAKKSIAWNQ
jgi:hypothetical protein